MAGRPLHLHSPPRMHALPCARFSIFTCIFHTRTQQPPHTGKTSDRKRRKISPVNSSVQRRPSKHPSNKAATGKGAGKLPLLSAAQERLAPGAISSRIATHGNRRNAPQPRGIRHGRASFGSTLCGGFSRLVSTPGFPLPVFRFFNSNTFFCWQCSTHHRTAMHTTTPTTRTLLP